MGNLLSSSSAPRPPPGTPQPGSSGPARVSSGSEGTGDGSAQTGESSASAATLPSMGAQARRAFREMCTLVRQSLVELPRAVTMDFDYQSLDLIVEKVEQDEKLLEPVLAATLVTMPLTNPLSPAMITILVDALPLPTRRHIPKFQAELAHWYPHQAECHRRNYLVVQAALGEKLAGHLSEICMTEEVMLLLLEALRLDRSPLETLFAIVACEKYAVTGANKAKLLQAGVANLLCILETKYCVSAAAASPGSLPQPSSSSSALPSIPAASHVATSSPSSSVAAAASAAAANPRSSADAAALPARSSVPGAGRAAHDADRSAACLAAQVGFCATWALDNVFPCEGRVYGALRTDLSDVNVMLDQRDATKGLKLAPDGLEIRNDSFPFESVKATCSASPGSRWYYEITLFTGAIMQLGWASSACSYLAQEGCGIGDDEHSFAYDGCRRLLWHQQQYVAHAHPQWRVGDTLGLYLDLVDNTCDFALNGKRLGLRPVPAAAGQSWYPAASLMTFQHVRFNFGDKPYRYPPPADEGWRSLNVEAQMDQELKKIIPRLMALDALAPDDDHDDSAPVCQICFDNPPAVMHMPCRHAEFCESCSQQLDKCPLCRTAIATREPLPEKKEPA